MADGIWRYLKHHPYVSTLRLNVINPGDGLLVLNAIRELQATDEFSNLNYDIAFYGDLRYEVMGSAFDEMTEESAGTEGIQSDVDEDLLRPNRNPLFPKLVFSKQRIRESEWQDATVREAHMTILIDRFSTKVLSRPIGTAAGSFCLHNLLAEYRADFDLKGESATWSRKVVPNRNGELIPGDSCAENIFRLDDYLLRTGACFFDWGNSLDKVAAIQLELSDTDKQIISEIHERSDWVITIDRNFGIEYFDNPRGAPGIGVRSYLIDYTPEFLEGIGHRLIVSTFWLTEIEGLIQDGLKKMGIPGTGFHAAQILDVLKSISGRLALKLIDNPKSAREIIGLALTRLLLEQDGMLTSGVIIPVDSHTDLFAEHRRQVQDADITVHRSDLILARPKDGRLCLRLIEVKFRSGAGSLAEEFELKEAIATKNTDTQSVLEGKFLPGSGVERLDSEIQSKQLADLLRFYFERSQRHGLITPGSPEALALQDMIKNVELGVEGIEFEKAGYIFNLNGVSKPEEEYKGNEVYVVGREKIRQLLEIAEDMEAQPENPSDTSAGLNVEPAEQEREGTVTSASLSDEQPSDKAGTPDVQNRTPELGASKQEEGEPSRDTHGVASHLRVLLGKNCDSGKDVYWDPFASAPKKLANQHILIVGKSGAGKTQAASSFICGLTKANIPAVIFDFQGEYMSTNLVDSDGQTFLECTKAQVLDAADGIEVNPLDVPIDPYSGKKQNFMKVVYQVASSLARIFGLGDIQHAILRDAISQAYGTSGFSVGDKTTWDNSAPTLSQVWKVLCHKEATVGGNVRNLNLRVQPLFETGVFLDYSDVQGFDEVLGRTSVIRLSNLATPELMVAVSRFVLQKMYASMLSQGPTNRLRVFAVVDEAHKLSYEETLSLFPDTYPDTKRASDTVARRYVFAACQLVLYLQNVITRHVVSRLWITHNRLVAGWNAFG